MTNPAIPPADPGQAAEYPVEVRPSSMADLDDIYEFIQPFVDAGRLLPRTLDELEGLIPTGFIALVEGEVVGFVALEVYSRKLAEVRSLCVSSAHQGRGIGKKLTLACVELARRLKVYEVMAITSSDEFFRSCGFDFTLPGEKKALFMLTRDEH
ncbi:MAG: GNAT family N-acetyltransferase [Planctomycetota bacterium]|nr:MAG: GNAT family N-acetyltransferase [Planctomycetota bacterium]